MKVLISSNKNPHFFTITEYVVNAFSLENEVLFFDNRGFLIPGRIRERSAVLARMDLQRINNRLIAAAGRFKPDLFLELGGHRILPETVMQIQRKGIMTALWTIDAPNSTNDLALQHAMHYDHVFTGGSEAFDLLKERGFKNLHFLPFACDPSFHHPMLLSAAEKARYGCDIAFVGTLDPRLYSYRVEILQAVSDFHLCVWGPGSRFLRASPLQRVVRADAVTPDTWTKIYSAAKIVLCIHYYNPSGTPCAHQVSPRVYEALACGAFLAVDERRDIWKLFKDKQHLVVFRNVDELRELLTYYLAHPGERDKIARRGREEVLAKHTYVHRARELCSAVEGERL